MSTNCRKFIAMWCLLLAFIVPSSYADSNPPQALPRQAPAPGERAEGAPAVRTVAAPVPGEKAGGAPAVRRAQAVAQEKTRAVEGTVDEVSPPTPPGTAGKAKKPAPRATGPISLSFDDADMYQVIQTVFGEILRVNYVVDQRVKGRVTFRSVKPVEGDQVLSVMEVILRLNGVGVVEESGLYRIVPIADVAKEPAEVTVGRDPDSIEIQGKSIIRVVPVMYSQSSEIVKLIMPFLTATASVIDVPNINHVMLVDTDANVRRLLRLIDLFDSEQTRKKKPQVFVYHVQNSKAKDIANILQQIFLSSQRGGVVTPPLAASPSTGATASKSTQPSAAARSIGAGLSGSSSEMGEGLISPITKIIPEENLNSLIILSLPEDYEVIKEAIRRVDIIPRQVVIEGVIAEITLKDDLKLGVSWALQFSPDGMNGVLGAVSGTVGFDVPGATAASTTGSGTFSFAGTVGSDFKAVIDTLATQSKAKLLAVPRILVTDNKEARIQVGEQVPIVTTETIASTITTAQRTIQYKDIGIILKVKPRINEGGLVSLDLAQEVSSYDTITLFDGETNIIVKKTEATTNLVVQDGQTILIGGLIREDISTTRSGIPFLSKIPLLGYLFGSTTDEDHRKELIILLTPRVIKNQRDARKVTSSYVDNITKTGKGKLKKKELIRDVPQEPDGAKVDGVVPQKDVVRTKDARKDQAVAPQPNTKGGKPQEQTEAKPVEQTEEEDDTEEDEVTQTQAAPAGGDVGARGDGAQQARGDAKPHEVSAKTIEGMERPDGKEARVSGQPAGRAKEEPAPKTVSGSGEGR